MRKKIFILLLIVSKNIYAQNEIHWEIIPPSNFLDFTKNLNISKELYLKEKVSKISYKLNYDFVKDSTYFNYNAKGLLVKEVLNYDKNVETKYFADTMSVKMKEYRIKSRDYEYDDKDNIKNIRFLYSVNDSKSNLKCSYQYSLYYTDSNLMNKIIVRDSIGKNIGKIVFEYNEGRLTTEKCYWGGDLIYTITHNYLVDTCDLDNKGGFVVENQFFNNTLFKKSIFLSKDLVLDIWKNGITEYRHYEIPLDSYYSKLIINNRLYNSSLDGNLIAVKNDIKGRMEKTSRILLRPLPYSNTFGLTSKIIYNQNGLILKEIEIDEKGADKNIVEYKYEYRK